MAPGTRYTVRIALIVALGGFLTGFDASVISGVVGFIEPEFALSKVELGWAVASLTLTATVAMMLAGPLSDRIGRRPVLMIAAVMFAVSAAASAIAPSFAWLVLARMLGGFGVGAALIIAPMYIAEMSPPAIRGRMVSFNQLNIVIGISTAFFSNYLILRLGQGTLSATDPANLGEWNWRWMLGIEALPSVGYLAALLAVPESPRWLAMHGRHDEALEVLRRASGEQAEAELAAVEYSLETEAGRREATLRELFVPGMRLALTIGISIAVLQQITGINAVFFYAPMIFEQSGIGTDASFMQAVLVGLVNLVFTVVAILLIDRLGRRPLLAFGLAGIAGCMLLLGWGFGTATYTIDGAMLESLSASSIDHRALAPLVGQAFDSDVSFRHAVIAAIGEQAFRDHQSVLVSGAISVNPTLILLALLGFVASFAVSVGPIMWVLFSELFPNRLRGIAVSFVGFINSAVSFTVQLVFPWELDRLGNSATFLIYGILAIAGLFFVMRLMPETRGKSLEAVASELAEKETARPERATA